MFGEWLGWSNGSGSGKGESGKERRAMAGAGQVTPGFACLAKEPGLCRPKRTSEVSGQGSNVLIAVLPRLLWQRRALEQMQESGNWEETAKPRVTYIDEDLGRSWAWRGEGGTMARCGLVTLDQSGSLSVSAPDWDNSSTSSSLLCGAFPLCELGNITLAPDTISRGWGKSNASNHIKCLARWNKGAINLQPS